MKKIGFVSQIIKGNTLLVQSKNLERLGTKVVNQQIKYVGKIVDIIGNTSNLFFVINTKESEVQTNKGDMLYILETKSPKEKFAQRKTIKKSSSSSNKKNIS